MKIFVLDDDPERLSWFVREFVSHDLVVANSVEGAIAALSAQRYDAAFLDHDLGGKTFVPTSSPDCGMRVAEWLVENPDQARRVVVHSWNVAAAKEMAEAMRGAGLNARDEAFATFDESILRRY